MRVAGHNSRGTSVVLLLSLLHAANAHGQENFSARSDMVPAQRMNAEVWAEKCSPRLFVWPARAGVAPAAGLPIFRDPGEDGMLPLFGDTGCAVSAEAPAVAGVHSKACGSGMRTLSSAPGMRPCRSDGYAARVDPIADQLSTLGKAGATIARVRSEVLDILASRNACSEWFASKDAASTDTFRSLSFSLDRHGQEDVIEWHQSSAVNSLISRQPYVARTTQDGGAYAMIDINANGAFYRAQGNARRLPDGGGPALMDGSRVLRVASYRGNTLEAQLVTLLHEFGHIINLLPEDGDDLDGRSAENSNEVLRHCRWEVEARAQEVRQSRKK